MHTYGFSLFTHLVLQWFWMMAETELGHVVDFSFSC